MNYRLAPGSTPRFSLCMETQFIEWPADGGMPIVDFLGCSDELNTYDSEDKALDAIDKYLAQVGATVEWSDVRPIETCACCKCDIDTSKSHKVLSLCTEVGPDEDITLLNVDYPARFCNVCVPIKFDEVAA
jgi:hypothetical protein